MSYHVYTEEDMYAAMANSEVGGGEGYDWPDRPDPGAADATVTSASALESAIDGSETYIYVPSSASIDISGIQTSVSGTKVIYGDGMDSGSLLYSDDYETSNAENPGHLEFVGDVRLTGLEVRGPMWDHWHDDRWPGFEPTSASESGWGDYVARFGSLRSDDVRVDNCEIHGWPSQAFGIGTIGSLASPELDHNKMHNCMLTSLGYAFTVYRGHPHVHHNYFNAMRHAVNGSGQPDSSYTVENNLFGPYWSSHQIDMHSLSNNSGGSSSDWTDQDWYGTAGGDLIIRNNTFTARYIHDEPESFDYGKGDPNFPAWPIAIRGYPWPRDGDVVVVENNRFIHPEVTDNDPDYRNGSDDERVATQQLSGGDFTIPDSQLGPDNFTVNWAMSDNMYDAVGKPYDPDYGAPVDLEDAGSVRSSRRYRYPRTRMREMLTVIEES